jgi:muconolactone delta-isomerase
MTEPVTPSTPAFLVQIEIALPPDLDADTLAALGEAEARRGVELQDAGTIERIWRVPGRRANVGIWRAADADALHAAIASLPMWPYMDVSVTVLARHPLEQDG